MTTVDTTTGEIVEFDAAAAERRAERISLRLDTIADNYRAVLPMIREAIEKRDDIALGYRSPGDYVSDRFGQALAGLGIEVRRAVVGELTEAGLSTRAIAPIVGVNNATVHRDRGRVADATPETPAEPSSRGRAESTPAEEPQQGEGGITAEVATPAALPPRPAAPQSPETQGHGAGTASAEDPSPASPADCYFPAPVTGIDGKTYRRPTPTPKPARSGEQQNAEENSRTFASSLIFLLAFQHPAQRDNARVEWEIGRQAVSPTNRDYVTPDRMRQAAEGLRQLADEWESTHE